MNDTIKNCPLFLQILNLSHLPKIFHFESNFINVHILNMLKESLKIKRISNSPFIPLSNVQKYKILFIINTKKMNQLSSLIKKHKINLLLKSKNTNIFTSLSTFLDDYFQSLPKSLYERQQYLKESLTLVIQQLQRQTASKTQKLWIRLILIEMVLNKSDPSLFSSKIADILNSLCKLKPTQLTVSDKISQSFFSFTSLLGLKKVGMNNPQRMEQSSLFDNIIMQISLLLRKKLSDWQFFLSFQQNQQQKKLDMNENYPHYKSYQQRVWKVANHLKAYNIIVKIYKSIQTIDIKMKPFMLATLHLLGLDIIKMYPSIVRLIEYQLQIVQQQYEQIRNLSNSNSHHQHQHHVQKQQRIKLLQAIHDSHLFIQLGSLIKQLECINLTLMYIFYGIHHKNDLVIKLPKEFILNSGHVKLDFVHQIEMEVKHIKEKRLKNKKNLVKLSNRMCKSEDIKKNNNSQSQSVLKNLSQLLTSNHNEQLANSLQQQYVSMDPQQNLNKKATNLQIDETQESESFIDQGNSDQNTYDQVVDHFY